MTSTVNIRTGISADIPFIQGVAVGTWPATYGKILKEDQLDYMLGLFYSESALQEQMNNGHTFLIAEAGDNAIGFASFNLIDTAVYKLQKLYLLPVAQGTGAGKLLLNEVIERIKAKGCKKLHLNVNRYNNAKGFYEKMGFAVISEEDIAIGNGYFMNDFVMELPL